MSFLTRSVMGVLIQDTGGETIMNRVMSPTKLVKETKPLVTQHLKREIVAKMSIAPAPRKSGTLGGGSAPAADGKRIGPPDATITGRKMGLGGFILIGVAILTVLAIFSGGRR